MIYDFITNMYFTGMTHGGMIHLSRESAATRKKSARSYTP
jgi:hypothetical protein